MVADNEYNIKNNDLFSLVRNKQTIDCNTALRYVTTLYMAKFMVKLSTKLQIPISVYNFNCGLAKAHDIHIAKFMVVCGADNFNWGLMCARDIHIAKFMVECGAKQFTVYDYNQGLAGARDIHIAKFMVECGADNFNLGLAYARNLNKAKYMVELLTKSKVTIGADDFNQGLVNACMRENDIICDYLIECGATVVMANSINFHKYKNLQIFYIFY